MPIARMLFFLAGALVVVVCFVGGAAVDREPASGRGPAPSVDDAARAIDRLMAAAWKERGVRPNPEADDATWVRRAFLDIVGRIPTVAEASAFLRERGARKHERLVDALLDSPGSVHREFHFWADLVRAKSDGRYRALGEGFVRYLKAQIAANRPYDEMVREMLTAEGAAWDRDNGEVGYLLRDFGMPDDNMANTVQVFLGTRIQCAQCHDHPFDRWTQRDFLHMAAFVHDTRIGRGGAGMVANRRGLRRELRKADLNEEEQRAVRRIARILGTGVTGGRKGEVRADRDVRGEGLEPGDRVAARTLFGERVGVAKDQDPREVYADWLVDPENPRFTRVIVNRLWKKVFGRGLIEPVDDLRDDTEADLPELLAYLERLLIDYDYDLERFQAVLYRTRAYRLEATAADLSDGAPHAFPGPVLRRMRAEQIWDSVLTLVVPDLDERIAEGESPLYAQYDELRAIESTAGLVEYFKRRASMEARRREIGRQFRELRQELKANAADRAARARIRGELQELRAERERLAGMAGMAGGRDRGRGKERDPRWKGFDRGLRRASELRSPAPPGHFLRQFGQSDREQIENASREGNLTQALALLNGYVDQHLLRRESVLTREVAAREGIDERIDVIFLAILSRGPSADERRLARSAIGDGSPDGYADLIWALLNTHEFLFVR